MSNNNYQINKEDVVQENESKIQKIKNYCRKHWKGIIASVALLAAIGGCSLKSCNANQNDLDKSQDDPKPPVEDQVQNDDVKKPEVPKSDEEEEDKVEVDTPVASEIGEDQDKTNGNTNSVVRPVGNETKKPGSNSVSDKDNEKDKDVTAQPKDEVVVNTECKHADKKDEVKYISYYNGTHVKETTTTCNTCSEVVGTTIGRPEDCDFEFVTSNVLKEYWKCDDCGYLETRDHNFTKTDDGEGTITYDCENDGCDYSYIEEYDPEDDKNNSNNNNNNNNGSNNGGNNNPDDPNQPTEPDKPTDPDQPTEPDKPTEPDQPTEPDKPTDPDQPTEPDKPTDPDQPTEPDKPTDPDKPTEPDKPEQDRPDQTPGTGDNNGFVGGDEVTPAPGGGDDDDEDYGYDSYSYDDVDSTIEELNALKYELLQVKEDIEASYDYETNTLILSK